MDKAFHAVVGQTFLKNEDHVTMPAVDPEFTIHDFPPFHQCRVSLPTWLAMSRLSTMLTISISRV